MGIRAERMTRMATIEIKMLGGFEIRVNGKPVLAQLAQLRHSCEAFRTGELRVLRAEDGILHYQRVGKVETAEIIVNRTEHIIVETLASGKSTEVNPMGFTIVVEEVGHNPNHSYYDYV